MTTVNIDNDYRIVVVNDSNGDTAIVTAPSPAVIVETTGLGPQGPGGIVALYGNFIDTTDQPLVSTSAAQPLTLNTTLENRGITVTNSSRINFELAGTYKILASLQVTNSGNSVSEVNFFFAKNGTELPNSNTRIDLEPRKSASVPYHDCFTIEFQLTVANDDYIELFWSAEHPDIAIDTIPPDALHPQAPSAIVNVAQVMYSQAGVPIGGNTGDVLVKSSSTNYDTVWTDAPTVDKLGLDTAAAETISTGQVAWDAPNATPAVRHRPNVIGRLGQDQHCLCKNTSAVSLIKGRVVMFTGADSVSGRIEIGPLLANGQYPGYVYFGVTAEAIDVGEFGMVCTFGFIEGIDTSIYPEDSILWACTVNPGAMVLEQNLQPAPALSIPTAVVVKSDPVDGVIFVRANTGAELRLLHDVYTDLAENGDVLTWVDSLNRWEAVKIPNAAPRSITIAGPKSGDNFTLFRTDVETTISTVTALVSGTGPSVTYEIRYATNRTSAGTLATVSETVTNSTVGDPAAIQNQPIPANSYVWLVITAVAGTVGEMNVTIAF
jgi:hypothetical protein